MPNSAAVRLSAWPIAVAMSWVLALGAQPASGDSRTSVDLSPDGRSLVFDSRGAIFTVAAVGGHATRMTSGGSVDTRPVWSPDGNRIAFVRSDGRRENVWVVDRQSRQASAITADSTPRRIVSLSWGANGAALAIAFGSSAPGFEIIDTQSRQVSRFTVAEMGKSGNHAVHALTFARDSRSLIIQGGDARTNTQQLYRFSFALRDQRAITDEAHGALAPAFDGDGDRLAFLTRADSGGMAIEVRDIAAARQRVAAVIPLPDSLVELPHFALARDGRTAFIASGGNLWRVILSTGRRQLIQVDANKP